MAQTAASLNQRVESTVKCSHCGLTNFRAADQCKRCKTELSSSLTGGIDNKPVLEYSADPARSQVRLVLISAVILAVLAALVMFYLRQGPLAAPEALNQSVGTQPATLQPQAEGNHSLQLNPQSVEAASKVLGNLKRFQQATDNDLSYAEYDQMVNQMNADLNNIMPAFAGHSPSDETFRQETAAAVRDYLAARNWWKTTVTYSSALDDTDRKEKLKLDWTSAKTHIENAEKVIVR